MINKILLLYFIIFTLMPSERAISADSSFFDFSQLPPVLSKKIQENYADYFKELPNQEKMDQILSVLYNTNEFESLKIVRKNNKIIISGTPLKTIASITIHGESRFSESSVSNIFGVSPGDKFIHQVVYEGAERIKEFYGNQGYFSTVVDVDLQNASQNKLHVKVQIEENAPCLIKNINFNTSYEDLDVQIKRKLKNYLDKPLTEENIIDIETAIKNFFIENKIFSASIQGPNLDYNSNKTETYITYTLENTYKYILLFEGNQFLSSSEISSKLDVNSNIQLGSNPAAELASKIEKIYREYGFAHVSVKYKENIQAKSFTRKANFTISEGARTFVRKIIFNGKLSKSQKYYVDIFERYYDTNIYDQEILKLAQESFLQEMQDQGFLKIHFISSQTTFSDDKKSADIIFFLDEGPQTRINNIVFKGINNFSNEQLKNVIGIKELTPLNLKSIEESQKKLSEFYKSTGYLDMELKSSISNLIKYSQDNTKADLFYEIYEGPQITVSKIIIEGNAKTKNHVILNELEFDIGEVITPQKMTDSELHLQRTQLFSRVDISTLERGTQISNRTIIIRVEERDPGLFSLGIGANTEFDLTLRGYAGIGYNNIAGTARAVSARLEIKRVTDIEFIDHNLTLSYLEPTLFAKRTRGKITFIRAREILSRDPNTSTAQTAEDVAEVLETNKVNFLIEKDFTRYFKLSWILWSISTNKEFSYPSNLTLEKVRIASFGPIFEYDRRDHPFVTRKGFYGKLSAEYGDPEIGSSDTVHYFRTVAQTNAYVPFKLGGIVWANSISGGYLKNTADEDSSSVPDVKAFKLGGRDTLRGFDPNEIPHSTDANGNSVQVSSESHYYLFKTEFRIPILGQFESVFFYDGGGVLVEGNRFTDNYRDSAGLGFRYMTPVGPLSLEYGHKLDRDRALDESPGRFHLSFGTF